jgi:PAS domain S-box-containing protein
MPHPSALPDQGPALANPLRGIPLAIVYIASVYAIVGGSLSLLGWVFEIRRLTDWNNEGISMFANTALCAVFCGISLALTAAPATAWRWRIAGVAACFAFLVGGLTLFEHITGANLGIDTLLFERPWGQRAATAPMRMGPPAATSFLLLGIALSIAGFGPRARRVASAIALLPVGIASLSLIGYWFGADQLFGVARFTGIALQTSTMIAALGIGTMAAFPEHGLVAVLCRADTGGALLRRLIVPVIIIPLALGWLRILGQDAGLYDTAFGTALRTVIEVGLFVALVWWASNSISRVESSAGEAQGRLAAIVESSGDAIVSKSLQGVIRTWNSGAERLFGYTSAEAVGRNILMLIPADRINEETDILEHIQRGERVEHYDTVRVRKDGSRVHVSLTVSPVRDAAGNIVGASKIARDITERIRSEEALRRSEAELKRAARDREELLAAERAARSEAERVNLIKDEFLATLSHELRTPLSAILGWSQLLATGDLAQEDVMQGLEAIERNARAQTELIEDLLDMSRIISGKLRLEVQWTDIANVVDQAVESVRPSAEVKQIRLRKIIDPHPGPVSGDPIRLQQVFWNLLSNAIKFTPKGGSVDVLLERVDSHLEITIHDSGVGIKPEMLPYVFERFRQADSSTTRSYGGLGLGLSIVKSLVELHGGTVRAQSPGEGQGATFVVTLPLAPIRSAEKRDHPTALKPVSPDFEPVRLPGVKVLVVDDEPDARELLKRVLRQSEAEVTTAENGRQGLDLLRTHKPDVIVSDIGMPGMDGYEFIREVRRLLPADVGKIPAIALTAFARSEDRTKAMLAGYQVHVAKPIEPQELVATVGSLVRGIR